MSYRLIQGDCIEVMAGAKAESIDAIVCDPPYGIDFMGKSWDNPGEMVGTSLGLSGGFQKFPEGVKRPEMKRSDPHLFQLWCEAWATEAMRVLKPGGHLLAFGGTRMYHRLAAGIEDAGFEIRDCVMWMYGSGFPKSHNVGVNIDKTLGHKREMVPMNGGIPPGSNNYLRDHADGPEATTKNSRVAVTPEAERWNGWGTALKPAVEPIVVARKPLSRPGKRPGTTKKATVAQNVLEHGVGAYNLEGCAVEVEGEESRHPANVIMDEESGALLGDQARFFYCPKASRAERDRGLTLEPSFSPTMNSGIGGREHLPDAPGALVRNTHTTVKPIALMRYLIRLVVAEGGVVLDPFMGSGTTGIAAKLEGMKFVGIERDEAYHQIAEQRVASWELFSD